MPLSNCLKTGLRSRARLFCSILLLFCRLSGGFAAEGPPPPFYTLDDDLRLLVSLAPPSLEEDRLRRTILRGGGRAEIIFRFRIKSRLKRRTLLPRVKEIELRKTGFRDAITGDLVLQDNGREAGTYRSWEAFYRDFSRLEEYPLRAGLLPGDRPEVHYRFEIVYKKLVAPLNLLYLIPGRFITRSVWLPLPDREGGAGE